MVTDIGTPKNLILRWFHEAKIDKTLTAGMERFKVDELGNIKALGKMSMVVRVKKIGEKLDRGVVTTDKRGYARAIFEEAFSEVPDISYGYIGKRVSIPIRSAIPTTIDITFVGEPKRKISWKAAGVVEIS